MPRDMSYVDLESYIKGIDEIIAVAEDVKRINSTIRMACDTCDEIVRVANQLKITAYENDKK